MIKFLVMSLFALISLDARENPFFPAKNEIDLPLTTNQIKPAESLKRVAITLPSTARVLQSITVSYKNLDGSVVNKTEEVNAHIDWHLPLFISQNIGDAKSGPSKKRVQTHNKDNYIKLGTLQFIGLHESKNVIKIVTKDKLIRNFLLTKPHRIVCDFKRDIDIRSYVKSVENGYAVKRVRVGNHKGYYRLVIELDGHYKYSKKTIEEGYIFNLM